MKKKEITKLKKTINEIKEKYKKDEKNIEINALTRLMKNTTLKSEEKAKKKIKLKNVENTKKKIKLKKGEKAKTKIKKDTGSKIIKEAKKKIKLGKKIDIEKINQSILEIEKMDMEKYLEHLKEKDNKKNCLDELPGSNMDDDDGESTIDEALVKIKNLKNLQDDCIKYDLEF